MRVSLTARFVSHPTIDFGAGRRAVPRARLGLAHGQVVYHGSRVSRTAAPTIRALRSGTSGFRFASMPGPGRVLDRRVVLPIGLQRVRRA